MDKISHRTLGQLKGRRARQSWYGVQQLGMQPCPTQPHQKMINSLTHKRWNSNRHAHTDLILGNHHTKTLKILTNNLNNRTRYRTGICIITGHLQRINRSDTSNCPNCTDTEETVAHYIGKCPAYSRIRGDTLGTYYDSINNIMDNNNIDLIINFALKTKRLLKKEEKDDTGVTYNLYCLHPLPLWQYSIGNGIILTLAATHTLTPYIPHLTLTPTQSTLTLHPPSSPQTCLHRTRHYPLAG